MAKKCGYVLFDMADQSIPDEDLVNNMEETIAGLLSMNGLSVLSKEERIAKLGETPFTEAETEAVRAATVVRITVETIDDVEGEFAELLGTPEHRG